MNDRLPRNGVCWVACCHRVCAALCSDTAGQPAPVGLACIYSAGGTGHARCQLAVSPLSLSPSLSPYQQDIVLRLTTTTITTTTTAAADITTVARPPTALLGSREAELRQPSTPLDDQPVAAQRSGFRAPLIGLAWWSKSGSADCSLARFCARARSSQQAATTSSQSSVCLGRAASRTVRNLGAPLPHPPTLPPAPTLRHTRRPLPYQSPRLLVTSPVSCHSPPEASRPTHTRHPLLTTRHT
jgi:hypothetical protein